MIDDSPTVLDRTFHETHEWLNALADEIGGDRTQAYHALRSGLHALRDRMTPDEAVHLGQQLPLLIRGIYFEDWQPSTTPHKTRTREAYLGAVADALAQDGATLAPEAAAQGVFALLKQRVDAGELGHVAAQLPGEVTEMMRAA